jgi:CheY-like chemotaxis protein
VEHPTILYVEDEVLIATAIIGFLEGAGFAVTHVFDGAQATAMLSATEFAPVALVTDVRLPGGTDGWEIAREARERFPEIVLRATAPASGAPRASRTASCCRSPLRKPN